MVSSAAAGDHDASIRQCTHTEVVEVLQVLCGADRFRQPFTAFLLDQNAIVSQGLDWIPGATGLCISAENDDAAGRQDAAGRCGACLGHLVGELVDCH